MLKEERRDNRSSSSDTNKNRLHIHDMFGTGNVPVKILAIEIINAVDEILTATV